MFDGQPYRVELARRLDAVRRILDASHPMTPQVGVPDATRESRGLAVVLLFASYENLLTSLCRRLLEIAQSLRVGNRRLRNGLRLFAVHGQLQGLGATSGNAIWRGAGLKLLECAFDPRNCTINVDLFPADGSYMKRSQVALFCDLFELGDPGPILREVWSRLDTVVTQRNGIAHGRLTPEEVGRNYSLADIKALVDLWETRWVDFVAHVEAQAQNRNFYRYER